MRNILIFLFLLLILLTGCSIKNCETDLDCFKESAKYCYRARVNIIHEGNNIRLTCRGFWFGKCKLSLKIEEIGNELKKQDPNLARIAKGKTLNCAIPVKILETDEKVIDEILNIENRFNEYCSGPIKDVLQGPLKDIIKEKMDLSLKK